MSQDTRYHYDVFISYPRGEEDTEISKWVTDIFLAHFKQCLLSELGRRPEVYIDVQVNKPGDKWEQKLKDALGCTRILVPIWSINYFRSAYCRAELAAMLHREKKLGYWEQERRGSLIVPIQLWDGKKYPQAALEYQQLLCGDYSSVRRDTDPWDRLMLLIKQWVPDLARRIESVPDWDSSWLTKEWLDDPIKEAEQKKILWPPQEVYYLSSMVGNSGDDDA